MELRMIEDACCARWKGVKVCVVVFCMWHSVESGYHHDEAPSCKSNVCLGFGAAMELRLIEQGCGCSMVRCGGGVQGVHARLLPLALGWKVLATATKHLQV